jgi:hypothetical protein
VETSYFFLPQSSGLLNPGQSKELAVHYQPTSPGHHTTTLALCGALIQGYEEVVQDQDCTLVRLRGAGVALTEALLSLDHSSSLARLDTDHALCQSSTTLPETPITAAKEIQEDMNEAENVVHSYHGVDIQADTGICELFFLIIN